MAFLANALVIGKIVSIASNILRKEWKPVASSKTAQKCPVCEGRGIANFRVCSAHQIADHECRLCRCYGCIGKGWVVV